MQSGVTSHSHLGASGCHRWLKCPGSVRECASIPEEVSEFAELGTAAHTLAESCLRKDQDAREHLGVSITTDAGMTFIVDQNMTEAVQVYLDTVRDDLAGLPNSTSEIERRVHLDWLHEDLWGTSDYIIEQPWGKLIVYDYKHGEGYYVEEEDNSQMKYYALESVKRGEFEEVELVIVQPRCRGAAVRRWSTSEEYLMDWAYADLLPGAEATMDPDAPLIAGPWCGQDCWPCKNIHKCPAVQEKAATTANMVFKGQLPDRPNLNFPAPQHMTEQQIARVMEFQGVFGPWAKAVSEYALGRMKSGVKVSGQKLVEKRANRKWTDEVQALKVLAPILGDAMYAPRKIRTPAQMETLLKQNKRDPEALKPLIFKPKAGLTIAPESDKRKAAAQSATEVFKGK